MNITSQDLQIFLSLAEEKNFTRAAARCALSQSAFSTRIASLEHALGAKLFDRTTRRVELTADGEEFEPFAHRLHAEFSDIVQIFRDRAARRRGRVSIAALPSVSAGWMPGVLADFDAAHPDIHLSLVDAMATECIAMIRDGDVDFGLSTLVDADDLESHVVGIDHFYLVCRNDHELLTRKRITAADIASFPFIHLARGSSVRRLLEAAFDPLELRPRFEASYMATVAGLVEAGLGITIVPLLSLRQFARPTLQMRKLASPKISRPIYLIKRKGRTLSIAAQALYDAIARSNFTAPDANHRVRGSGETWRPGV